MLPRYYLQPPVAVDLLPVGATVLDELDDALPLIQSAAVAGRSAVHRQRKARRVQTLGARR